MATFDNTDDSARMEELQRLETENRLDDAGRMELQEIRDRLGISSND